MKLYSNLFAINNVIECTGIVIVLYVTPVRQLLAKFLVEEDGSKLCSIDSLVEPCEYEFLPSAIDDIAFIFWVNLTYHVHYNALKFEIAILIRRPIRL
jgi:hypothetical protein